ncbi:GrpB family protein [Lachnoclostridium phytofermentans]|uniref:GrpB family protein n=1 Tax=Lachnoclostridium phytofermentans TaxID=66219 RepID=UPI0002FABFD3|nr:GrpB family protein [Lachnoclostridium phytofermentans]
MEGVERNKVRLLSHNKEWENEFLQVKSQIETIWNNNILDIQHVGSTAISNICAKPILDIAVRVQSIKDMDVDSMRSIGYDYCGPQLGQDTYHLYVLRGARL